MHYCTPSCVKQLNVIRITLMLKRDYEGQNCSIARSLELIGERWSLLIIRDAFLGVRRFEDFQADLGVARNVLSARLARLVEEGILEKRLYQERPERYEYRLTEKGTGLWPVLVSLVNWGDKYAAPPEGPPRLIEHRGCGGHVTDHLTCDRCGKPLGARDVVTRPGPGVAASAA
jgi:DNA-binding HxlR family transcriptional regulator